MLGVICVFENALLVLDSGFEQRWKGVVLEGYYSVNWMCAY